MSGALTPRRSGEHGPQAALSGSVIVLSLLGAAAVARAPGFPLPLLYALLTAAGLRLLFGRGGRRIVPRPVLISLGATLAALSAAYIFQRLGRGTGPEALLGLLAVLVAFEALCLLCRQTTFGSFLLILLSSVHAAGAAFLVEDGVALILAAAYVAHLALTLLLFERRAALERAAEDRSGLRRVRAESASPLPARIALGVIATLIALGFPLGAALYLSTPRGDWILAVGEDDGAGADDGAADEASDDDPLPDDGVVAHTGPSFGTKGVAYGSVSEIKKDVTAWLEVSVEGETSVPRNVILRDNTQDLFDDQRTWRDTLSPLTRTTFWTDEEDGKRDGWVPLAHDGGAKTPRGRTLRITLKKGGHRRLYLQPNEARIRILRSGHPVSDYHVTETRNKTLEVSFPFEEGDVILQRVVPQVVADARLIGRRSDSRVSPQTSYLQVPAAYRADLQRRAEAVVKGERDPWTRARLLEDWLSSEAFTYTLALPRLDLGNPIVDFIENHRRGACEDFANALTMLLRVLGHPTRQVRGFWGGDPQAQRGSVILRGTHYHAWTEMFLEGVGWVPLNPTPPDRTPADASTTTVAAGDATDGETEPEHDFSFLGYGSEDWSHLWSGVGAALEHYAVNPVAALFRAGAAYVGFPLIVLAIWLLVGRVGHVRARRAAVPKGRKLPAGPYGKALLLLARKGVRRRRSQTLREFESHVIVRLPPAAGPLRDLTRFQESLRYGGGVPPDGKQRARQALELLRRALKPAS